MLETGGKLLDRNDTELMELLRERPIYALAKEHGKGPAEIRAWSDYDIQRAWVFLLAENGNGENVTEEEIQENIAARLRAKGEEMAEGILEHAPNYWTGRTRDEVSKEGYNAEYVAEELAKLGLAFQGEIAPRELAEGEVLQEGTVDNVRLHTRALTAEEIAHGLNPAQDDLNTGPLETPEE